MKKIIILFLLIIVSHSVFSQTTKGPSSSTSEYIYKAPPDPVVEQIVKNINEARINGNSTIRQYWENKLNEITKPQVLEGTPNDFIVLKNEQQSSIETLNLTTLNSGAQRMANSISRERVTGHIYAAIGVYGGGINSDTLKVYISKNNGINFNLIFSFISPGLKINENGLDVEAVSNGDSSYAFIAMNYTFGTALSSIIVRIRQDGGMYSAVGALGSSTNRYRYGRVTSDNANYTTFSYIYFTFTLDSLAGNTRTLSQKLFKSPAPFSTPFRLISGYQAGVGGFYGYSAGPAPDSAKMESDIAYVNTTALSEQIYTVTIVRGIPNVYGGGSVLCFTRNSDYGATSPTLFTYSTDTKLKESPRFAATGYLNNSAMVVTRRLIGGGDWDPYYFYSANIASGVPPAFTTGYVEGTVDTTLSVSVAALYRSNGTYLFSFNNLKNFYTANIYTKQFNNGLPGLVVQANPVGIPGSAGWGFTDAGFRNVNNDSCMVIWGGNFGAGTYVTGGCSGTFSGIGTNNSVIEGYRLAQNYPNPFNPSTIINFTLPVKCLVTIKIYDVQGKEIAQLINEEKQAGEHSAEFNGANLSSGVYYYKLIADGFSETKKMILIK